jgi:hypothetical protein
MITLIISNAVLLAVCAGACALAYKLGFAKGSHAGWCECLFAKIDADRARRDEGGRFKK